MRKLVNIMDSKRNVISEREILSVSCPACYRIAGRLCVNEDGSPLQSVLDQSECSFHTARIAKAQDEQITRLGFKGLTDQGKALVMYYAFVMLCDSVSGASERIFNQAYTPEQLQAFFCGQAINELRHDGIMKKGTVQDGKAG